MLALLEVGIKAFRSFRKTTTIAWPTSAYGLFLLTGENRLHPDMGANAVGKSSLWDAICWCFYGKSARGLRGPALANWDSGGATYVQTKLSKDGKEHIIKRSHSPNGLTLDGEEVEQAVIDDLLGIPYSVFIQTLLLGQFGTFFFDLAPQAKLDLFSSVLGLDHWTGASKKAALLAGSLEDGIQRRERKEESLRAEIGLLRELRKEARAEATAWAKIQGKARKELRKDLHHLEAKAEEAAAQFKEAAAANQSALSFKEQLERGLGEAAQHRDSLREQAADLTARLARLTERARSLKRQKPGETCSACGQKIPKAQVHRHLQEELKRAKHTAKWLHHYRLKLDMVELELDQLEAELSRKAKELRAATIALDATERDHNTERTILRRLKTEAQQKREQLEHLRQDQNPHLKRAQLALKRIKRKKDLHQRIREKLRALRIRQHGAGYWTKGFKEVRLWVVEKALRELELSVNSSLVHLGLADWTVEFDVERETKAGKLARGFQVLIKSPDSNEAVPWEAWCGGETQRLRIAGAAGLSDLICSRIGLRPAFEVWDEPTAHLSEEGVLDLLDYLKERSQKLERQVWLTDHRSHPSGSFDSRYLIVLDEKGSKVLTKRPKSAYHQRTQWERLNLVQGNTRRS